MREVGQSIHLQFKWNGDLALHLLGGVPRPLGNDIHVIVGHVRISLNRYYLKQEFVILFLALHYAILLKLDLLHRS